MGLWKKFAPWWNDRDKITMLNIVGQISKIGTRAFEGVQLSTFAAPRGLEEIGEYAFANCDKLTSVMFTSKKGAGAENRHCIKKGAFANCNQIRHAIVNKNCEISPDAFPEGTRIIRVDY